MGKRSVERKRAFGCTAIAAGAWLGASGFAGCSGSAEFTAKIATTDDRDASVDGSAGGRVGGGGGAGTGGAVGGGPSGGGATTTTPADGGKDAGDAALPPPPCTRDEDCAPFVCRGTPRCVSGVCAPSEPCESPEGGSCVNECVRTETGASCVAMGRDADRDGHRDALCAENPGDDCDDTEASVHTGATEVCDGLDNDCDSRTDSFGGLPLGGTITKIKDVAKSALLGLVSFPRGGFALLANEMTDMYGGAGNPSEVHVLNPAGGAPRTFSVIPHVWMNDSAMAAQEDSIVFAGWNEQLFAASHIVLARLKFDGTWATPVGFAMPDQESGSFGRALAPREGNTVLVYAHYANSSFSGIERVNLNPIDQLNIPVPLLSSVPWRAYRPHLIPVSEGFAGAWVAVQPIAGSSTEVTAEVRTLLLTPDAERRGVMAMDTFTMPAIDIHLRGEFVRPQIASSATALVVGYRRGEGKLGVVVLDRLGRKQCQNAILEGIASWNSSASLVGTPLGVLLAATSLDGDAVLYRVGNGVVSADKPCPVEHIGTLNGPGSRVALSERFEKRQMPLSSLGDPALAPGIDGRVAVAWVERDETEAEVGDGGVVNDPPRGPRIVLRMLGDKLCN